MKHFSYKYKNFNFFQIFPLSKKELFFSIYRYEDALRAHQADRECIDELLVSSGFPDLMVVYN